MKPSFLIPSFRSFASAASLLAALSLVFAGCGMGKKGESGLVVSSADPASANAGRAGATTVGVAPDRAAAGAGEDPQPVLERPGELAAEPERTEITGGAGPYKEYRVKKGDSLWSISREFGTSIDALKRANGMSADKLVAGKAIRIPVPGGSAVAEGTSEDSDSDEVRATLPEAAETAPKDKADESLPESLPSGVVPPDPPRRSSPSLLDEPLLEDTAPERKSETSIGDDGFLRFGDE